VETNAVVKLMVNFFSYGANIHSITKPNQCIYTNIDARLQMISIYKNINKITKKIKMLIDRPLYRM